MDRLKRIAGRTVRTLWRSAYRIRPAFALRNRPVRSLDPPLPDGLDCLVATKRGLYLLSRRDARLLLAGAFYGVTRIGDEWLAFQNLGSTGQILRFGLQEARAVRPRAVVQELSGGCHQIDMIDGLLWVCDTYNNRIRAYAQAGAGLREAFTATPPGELSEARASTNYAHMNSIWRGPDGRIFAFYHNETFKTGRPSEVAELDDRGVELSRVPVQATNGHNVLLHGDQFVYCDSMDGRLRHGSEVVFEASLFTRGLARAREHWLVGGSAYGRREERAQLGGAVFVLNDRFQCVRTIDLPGMVQEIRLIGRDFGLSQDASGFEGADGGLA